MSGILEVLAVEDVPNVFADLLEMGIAADVQVVRESFAEDAFSGQTKIEPVVYTIPGIFEEKPSSRQDEGGKWQAYTKNIAYLPVSYDGAAIELKITDKLRKVDADFSIKALAKPQGVIYELVVERDVREGQRVEGV